MSASFLPLITLCETNVDSSNKDLYHLGGYESVYHSKVAGKSKGSGLAIYMKNDLTFVEIPKLNRSTPDIEALFVEIANSDKPIVLGVVYRPQVVVLRILFRNFM